MKFGAEGLAGAAGDEADGDGFAVGIKRGGDEVLLLDGVVEAAHKLADGFEVLLGKDFGGDHDGALKAHSGDGEEGGDGDDGLAAADFALEEAVHGGGTLGHVCEGLFKTPLLGPGEGEGQYIEEGLDGGAGGVYGLALGCVLPLTTALEDGDLEEEELVEGEAAAGFFVGVKGFGEVGVEDRFG